MPNRLATTSAPFGAMTPTRSPDSDADRPQVPGDAAGPVVEFGVGQRPARGIDDGGPIGEATPAVGEVVAADSSSVPACLLATSAAMASMRSKLSMPVSCASMVIAVGLLEEGDQVERRHRVENAAGAQRRVVLQVRADSPGRNSERMYVRIVCFKPSMRLSPPSTTTRGPAIRRPRASSTTTTATRSGRTSRQSAGVRAIAAAAPIWPRGTACAARPAD